MSSTLHLTIRERGEVAFAIGDAALIFPGEAAKRIGAGIRRTLRAMAKHGAAKVRTEIASAGTPYIGTVVVYLDWRDRITVQMDSVYWPQSPVAATLLPAEALALAEWISARGKARSRQEIEA